MQNEPSGSLSLILPLPPLDSFGPAMRALNPRQRAFVYALLQTGSDNHTQAAVMAGYQGKNRANMGVIAWRLSHHPKIQAAIREEGQKRINSATLMAIGNLIRVANDTTHKDNLKAVQMLLTRSGFHEHTESTVKVEHSISLDDLKERLKRAADILQIDPSRLLTAEITDVEYSEVDETVEAPSGEAEVEEW